jgi:hypothetical protein
MNEPRDWTLYFDNRTERREATSFSQLLQPMLKDAKTNLQPNEVLVIISPERIIINTYESLKEKGNNA